MLGKREPHKAIIMPLAISIHSDTAPLKKVILGYAGNFHDAKPTKLINLKQIQYYSDPKTVPAKKKLVDEFSGFKEAYESKGVIVLQAKPVEGVPDQLTVRDIGGGIGETFVVASMKETDRQNEWKGIKHLLDQMDPSKVLFAPKGIVLEFGDVIVHKDIIYVGVSGQRTHEEGALWLAKTFPEFQVMMVHLKNPEHDEDVLHLDCAFKPVGSHYALIYPAGFVSVPKEIKKNFELIEVTKEEQQQLFANIASISEKCVISNAKAARINGILQKLGIEVVPVKGDEVAKTGGFINCSSNSLYRDG